VTQKKLLLLVSDVPHRTVFFFFSLTYNDGELRNKEFQHPFREFRSGKYEPQRNIHRCRKVMATLNELPGIRKASHWTMYCGVS